jgi:hypothetical protein
MQELCNTTGCPLKRQLKFQGALACGRADQIRSRWCWLLLLLGTWQRRECPREWETKKDGHKTMRRAISSEPLVL